MTPHLEAALGAALSRQLGKKVSVLSWQPWSGGCINRVGTVKISTGELFFAKYNEAAPADMFEREKEGLLALAAAKAIRVPQPIAAGDDGHGTRFLIMENISKGQSGPRFWEEFGRSFGYLHLSTQTPRAGFDHDNYIGSTLQPNGWMDDWVEFWRERRLGFQLRLARDNGRSTPELDALGDRLLARVGDLLRRPAEPCCLLHGDLWSGNYVVDARGEAVIFDPATYYGRREADLAMIRLYGNFPDRFHSAYAEVWPLAPGHEERDAIYRAYHLLNHLNLFGGTYGAQCAALLRKIV